MSLGGTASDNVGVSQVTYMVNGATPITATGTTSWSTAPFTLVPGTNTVVMTARDAAGNTSTDVLSINYTSPNAPPTVSLTAPTNGATFTSPATVTISATASDTDGTVSSVSFYAGSTLVGSDTTSPYSVTWNAAATGTFALTAVAQDNSGNTTTSSSRSVTINLPNGVPT